MPQLPHKPGKKMDDMVGFDNVFIIGIVDSIVEVFVCACLIYGVDEGKPFLMKPWLIWNGIGIFFVTINAFNAFVTVACVSVGQGFLLLLLLIPIVTISYLCWFMVQSVYLDIKEGKINGTKTFPFGLQKTSTSIDEEDEIAIKLMHP